MRFLSATRWIPAFAGMRGWRYGVGGRNVIQIPAFAGMTAVVAGMAGDFGRGCAIVAEH